MADSDVQFTTQDGKTFQAPTLKFDGPLDLLLYLIQQSEVNIYDIPISQITDQFLQYLSLHQDMELGVLSSFYKMASQLLAIKSRMLLPQEVEFDDTYEDPRKELVEQLIEYQKFKKYTQLLSEGNNGEFVVMRKENDFFLPFSDEELFKGVTPQTFLETFRSLMAKVSMDKLFNVYESVSIGEKITLIDELLETHEEITLEQVIVHLDSKLDIICSFMAILECCRWHKITISQEESYGTIKIRALSKGEVVDDKTADAIDDQYDQLVESGMSIPEPEGTQIGPEYSPDRSGDESDRQVLYDEGSEEEIELEGEEEENEDENQ